MALKGTCPRLIGNFRYFTANIHGAIEDSEGGNLVWIELRAQRILVYSRMPELGMSVAPMHVYPLPKMRSFKRTNAPAALVAQQRGDRADSTGVGNATSRSHFRLSIGPRS